MKEKLRYISIEKAQKIVNDFLKEKRECEIIRIEQAYNRFLAENIHYSSDIPPFNVSHFDGYAIRSKDTSKASMTHPIYLKVITLKSTSLRKIGVGEAVSISTGSKLIDGSDAVIPIEMVKLENGFIKIKRSLKPFQHLTLSGQDFKKGEVIFKKGHFLRAQDIKLLMELKKRKMKVLKKPIIAVVCTGSELTDKIENSNLKKFNSLGPFISTLIREDGGIPKNLGIVIDDLKIIIKKLNKGLQDYDAVLVIGGSSVGKEDYVWEAINSLTPTITIHGIKVQPGRVTSLGIIGGKAIVNLPGHVQSTLVGFYVLMSPVIRKILGLPVTNSYLTVKAVMSQKLEIKEFIPFERIRFVKIFKESDKYLIKPLIGDSSLNRIVVTANGFIKIPRNISVIKKGEEMEVNFLPGIFPLTQNLTSSTEK